MRTPKLSASFYRDGAAQPHQTSPHVLGLKPGAEKLVVHRRGSDLARFQHGLLAIDDLEAQLRRRG